MKLKFLSNCCPFLGVHLAAADGASVMTGKLAAVQALLKHEYPWLIYVHCAAHRLSKRSQKFVSNHDQCSGQTALTIQFS